MKPKFKNYEFGEMTFKSYCRPAGHGWEVGVTCAGKPMFVGNFVHKHEATHWWKKMNAEITSFCKKYDYMENASPTWHKKFFANYLYKCYYTWLDHAFGKYTREFNKAYSHDMKAYKKFEKTFKPHAA